jgi:hypothetical protein
MNPKYNGNVDNDRNEANYKSHFKTWLNLFFPDQVGTKNLNWFIFNQNKVLFTLLNGRNERNNKLETVRKDINLLLHFLEIAAAPKEIITKYNTHPHPHPHPHPHLPANQTTGLLAAKAYHPPAPPFSLPPSPPYILLPLSSSQQHLQAPRHTLPHLRCRENVFCEDLFRQCRRRRRAATRAVLPPEPDILHPNRIFFFGCYYHYHYYTHAQKHTHTHMNPVYSTLNRHIIINIYLHD